jgi:putative peptidoglycan lipid II flippase
MKSSGNGYIQNDRANTTESTELQTATARTISAVTLFSGLSLVFGYARDVAVALSFGANTGTDAFFTAILVPVMLGRVIISGALTPALIPVFSTIKEDRSKAFYVVSSLFNLSVAVLLLLSLVVALASEPLVALLAPGFDRHGSTLAAQVLVITAPAIGFLGLSALLGAVLNSFGHFYAPALGNALVNVLSFLAVPVCAWFWNLEGVAYGLTAGSALQVGLLFMVLRKQGWRYSLQLNLKIPEVKQVLLLLGPVVLFMLIDQTVTITERVLGSQLPAGNLTYLSLANKLYQVPVFVIIGALATVIFPLMAAASPKQYPERIATGFHYLLLLATPATICFFFLGKPIARLVFQHGEFGAEDTLRTGELLSIYSLAILPTGGLLLAYRALQARRKMSLVLLLSLLNAILYVMLALFMSTVWGVMGLPGAFALSQLVGAGIALEACAHISKNRSLYAMIFGTKGKKIIYNNAIIFTIYLLLYLILERIMLDLPFILAGLAVLAIIGISGMLYLNFCKRSGIEEAGEFLTLVKVRKTRKRT